MKISDKQELNRLYFEYNGLKKERMIMERKHYEARVRANIESDKILENRTHQKILHEEERALNKVAQMEREDEHLKFIKLTNNLNII